MITESIPQWQIDWKNKLANMKVGEQLKRSNCAAFVKIDVFKISDKQKEELLNEYKQKSYDGRYCSIKNCDVCEEGLLHYYLKEDNKDNYFKLLCPKCNLEYDEYFFDAYG